MNKHIDTKGGKWQGWGQGGGVMNWVIGIDMYTLMCIKWMTNKNLLYKKNFFFNFFFNFKKLSKQQQQQPKRLQIKNAGESVEKNEPSYTVGENVNWCSHYGGSLKN